MHISLKCLAICLSITDPQTNTLTSDYEKTAENCIVETSLLPRPKRKCLSMQRLSEK